MIPGYTGKTNSQRKLVGKPERPYPEYDQDMLTLATAARQNLFPGAVHNPEVMTSTTHRVLKETGKVWENGNYEVDTTFHTKWSEDKDVMDLTLAYQRQQKVFKQAAERDQKK